MTPAPRVGIGQRVAVRPIRAADQRVRTGVPFQRIVAEGAGQVRDAREAITVRVTANTVAGHQADRHPGHIGRIGCRVNAAAAN